MLLSSVIIILREVLEAAMLLCILLAMSRFMDMRARWFYASLAAGVVGAVAYGHNLGLISNAFDGAGQELSDAALQLAIYLLLLLLVPLMVINHYRGSYRLPLLQCAMLLAVALAVLREGSEIYVYLSAFRYQSQLFSGVITGALLGVGIGFSIGALCYYLLLGLPRRYTLLAACILLTLVGAGMCAQAARMLIQVDWLPSQPPLWDTSALLPEESLPGQLLYALISYEASPTPIEVAIYAVSMALMVLLIGLTFYACRSDRADRVPAARAH
ncbi:FTR1 family protein [Microbulbifer sp. SAOS-129_SWC]|uniref:FTR1 family protein n=1 Tax=Microbulbifer sp. SAOS-129_SWC TaxID=3145235 RepID=UPI003218073A